MCMTAWGVNKYLNIADYIPAITVLLMLFFVFHQLNNISTLIALFSQINVL